MLAMPETGRRFLVEVSGPHKATGIAITFQLETRAEDSEAALRWGKAEVENLDLLRRVTRTLVREAEDASFAQV